MERFWNERYRRTTDLNIPDTVLIAAALCMYNRYLDGLATWQPRDDQMYTLMGGAWQSKVILAKPHNLLPKRLLEHSADMDSGSRRMLHKTRYLES